MTNAQVSREVQNTKRFLQSVNTTMSNIIKYAPKEMLAQLHSSVFKTTGSILELSNICSEAYTDLYKSQEPSAPLKEDLGIISKAELGNEAIKRIESVKEDDGLRIHN